MRTIKTQLNFVKTLELKHYDYFDGECVTNDQKELYMLAHTNRSFDFLLKSIDYGKEILSFHDFNIADLDSPFFDIDMTNKLEDLSESAISECHSVLYTLCAYTGDNFARISRDNFIAVAVFLLSLYSDVELDGKVLAKVFEDAMKLDELLGTEGGYAIERLKVTCMPEYDWLTNPLIRVVDIVKALLCDDTLLDSYLGDCEGERVNKDVVGILRKYVK